MSANTPIQWCDSTVNPVMGCDGCELWTPDPKGRRTCYAGVLHKMRGGNPGYAPTFLEPTEFAGRMAKAARWSDLAGKPRLDKPWLDGQRRKIFVSDMGDALSERIEFEFLHREILSVASSEYGNRHDWLWLTKRPERMARFSAYLTKYRTAWPRNLWAGTSITAPGYVKRIDALRAVGDETTTRFLSVEPQTEYIKLLGKLDGISWVVQGGESGPQAGGFDIAWARDTRDVCSEASVAYLLKQLGRRPYDGQPTGRFRTHEGRRQIEIRAVPLPLRDGHGGDWSEWPADLRVRQFPEVRA